MEERKAAEAGDGLEARRCGCAPLHPGPHRDRAGGEGERRRGRRLGDAQAPAWVNPSEVQGGQRAREGGQQDRQLLAMNINYFLHRQGFPALTVS